MTKRKGISNRLRFDVFKRDLFTCQYCGKRAPEVVLNVDHIKPVADGGNNSIMNLTTSCFACNSGKSDRALSDSSAVEKARAQADLIQVRKDQIRMMAEWQIALSKMEPEVDAINEALKAICPGKILSDIGRKDARKLVRNFSVPEVIEAMAIAYDQYPMETAFSKIGGIAHNLKIKREDPDQDRMRYVLRGLTRKLRGPDWKQHGAIKLMLRIRDLGGDWLAESRIAENSAHWDEYLSGMEAAIINLEAAR